MRLLKKILNALLFAPIALFLLFEEWGWDRLAAAFAALGRLPVWRQLERLILRLPPWAALLTFAVPVMALIPVKLLALYLLGQGHVGVGVGLIVVAKFAGTALAARLFQLTQPALMQILWFAKIYILWKVWKDDKLRRVRCSLPWRWARSVKHRVKPLTIRLTARLRAAMRGRRS